MKDWSKIEREITEELEEDEKTGKSDLDKFFQKIYANGTEEQKRAMMKSFQTSGGTVLSTNWTEVESANYDTRNK